MTESELINLFINWMKLDENLKTSYNTYIKENKLKEWNQNYFNNELFEIDYENIPESVKKIENLVLNNKNQDWKDFSKSKNNQAPEAILGNENYLKFLKIQFLENTGAVNENIEQNVILGKNFFSTNTNATSIDKNAPLGTEEFVFEGIYTLEDKIRIGDIIFFTQHGDKPKWDPGLSAICEVTKAPYEKGYDSTKAKNFRIKMKPLIVLPGVLNRSEFMGYFNCYDVTFIGPTTKGEPNQAISSMAIDKARHVTGAIIDTFPQLKEKIEEVFGKKFPITTLKAVVPNERSAGSDPSLVKDKVEEFLQNKIGNEVPRNLIVYGAPGTGKSYKLKTEAEKLFPNEWLRTRITFHPNYSYRNFVGSYKPKPLYKESDKQIFGSDTITKNAQHQKEPYIEYQFEPGPFLEMLVKALKNPEFNFVLIIEEINRANTAGVFGDVFQLLDRNETGESEYSITLEPSAHDYLKANMINTSSLTIPKNLYLWATMNSADQGVMPLDSAFKRRWSFEHIGLNENMKAVDDIYIEIPFYTNGKYKVRWNEFRRVVNAKLLSEGIHEDKLIGPFFLNKFEISDVKSVKNKLLLYLKEDVLRYKSCLFHGNLRSFSEISECFTNSENIFSDDIIFTTEASENNDDNEQRLVQTNSEGIEIEKTETQNIDAE